MNYLPRCCPVTWPTTTGSTRAASSCAQPSGDRIPEDDRSRGQSVPRLLRSAASGLQTRSTFLTNYISVGQRRGGTNYNASFQNTRESGVITGLNGFSRQNFRINLDHAFSEKVDLSTGAFYARSTADQTDEGLTGQALFFGLRFLEPNIDLKAPTLTDALQRGHPPAPLSANVGNPLYVIINRHHQRSQPFYGDVPHELSPAHLAHRRSQHRLR